MQNIQQCNVNQVRVCNAEYSYACPRQRSASSVTVEDTRRTHILTGYSLKHWDTTEEPIRLLGSVFDANLLGKWIYDWTVYHCGLKAPLVEMAGDLWLLLIDFAGRIKTEDEILNKTRKERHRKTVQRSRKSGERLWGRFQRLLDVCGKYVLEAAEKESSTNKPASLGSSSGKAFVDCIFGRDHELEETEKLMAKMRFWIYRFDTECEAILLNPSV
ncbi:vegetative cell wall gp1 [Pyrenophora seminiperda CCB06]|uniref:Vegetative cell wall gp1 n=1 Tax=Pyrenophora seminiperda CCB06 TaxID=1302712 RepID=A0A3M7LW00_9PLEO|nr:vegetative cell wall gp1 [Pyrenophora seminiperda CCB06]